MAHENVAQAASLPYPPTIFRAASMFRGTQPEMKTQLSASIRARPRPIFGLVLRSGSTALGHALDLSIHDAILQLAEKRRWLAERLAGDQLTDLPASDRAGRVIT